MKKTLIAIVSVIAACLWASAKDYTLYVDDHTGWSNMYVYAWSNGQPELFGSWPGAATTGTVTADGRTYKTYKLPESKKSYTFIFHDNGSNRVENGFSFVPSGDTYVEVGVGYNTLLSGQAEPEPEGPVEPAVAGERVPQNRVLYEVFVRNFSANGDFKGVEEQIPRIRDLGIDVIWLMPIYKLGDVGKWGEYSSPYAIKDYLMVNPDLGTPADLLSLVKTIHDNGMEVWFDWVGNHTSMDHVWTTAHPEYYKMSNGSFVNPNGWSDVYQLDINNPEMHEAMIAAMQYWVDEFDIDGYRCDYASGPSEEFWNKATSRVLKNGQRIAWLAEDDSKPQLVSNGYFDYNWVWGYQQAVKKVADNPSGTNINSLKLFCRNLHSNDDYVGRSRLMYLETHDIVQDQNGSAARLLGDFLKPMTVLTYTVYGMPMLYNGQEVGYNCGQVSLAAKTPVNWDGNSDITRLVTKLADLKHTQPALRDGSQNGTYSELSTGAYNIYAFRRTAGESSVVVMLNLSSDDRTFTIASGLPEGEYYDVFSDETATFGDNQTFTLPAYGYAVYVSTADKGGVDRITADTTNDETAVYYNLQGMQVVNPTKGMYIETKAGKSRKVIL